MQFYCYFACNIFIILKYMYLSISYYLVHCVVPENIHNPPPTEDNLSSTRTSWNLLFPVKY